MFIKISSQVYCAGGGARACRWAAVACRAGELVRQQWHNHRAIDRKIEVAGVEELDIGRSSTFGASNMFMDFYVGFLAEGKFIYFIRQ